VRCRVTAGGIVSDHKGIFLAGVPISESCLTAKDTADLRFGIGAGDSRLGILFAAGGVGSLLATLLLPRLSRTFPPERLTITGLYLGGAALVAVALAPTWWLAAILLAAWGISSMIVIVNGISVRMIRTPEPLQGRVNVVGRMLTFGVGQPLGAVAAGVLAERLPVAATLLLCAVPIALAAVAGTVVVRRRS